MEWILIASMILNLVALYKWFVYRCGFMGAFCIYQERHKILSTDELRLWMRKTIDYGIRQTINDFMKTN